MQDQENIEASSLSGDAKAKAENVNQSGADGLTNSPRRSLKGQGKATANLGTKTQRLQVGQESMSQLAEVGIKVIVGNTSRGSQPVLVIALYGVSKCLACDNWHFGLSCPKCQSESQSEAE